MGATSRSSLPRPRPFRCPGSRLAVLALLAAACTPPASPGSEGSGGRDNVVVILIDTLRADHLGHHGYDRPTSPFLDELAADHVSFTRAHGTAPHTVPSVLSLWSATYPARHGNQYYPGLDSFEAGKLRMPPSVPGALPLLAELFRERGYGTAAVVTNPWLQADWGFDRGFDEYRFMADAVAADVNRAALEVLDALSPEEPFLLYLHYMDVHTPYQSPDAIRDAFTQGMTGRQVYANGPFPGLTEEDLHYTEACYDASIRGLDEALKRLFAELRERDLADSTLFAIVSDHGEEFGDHGGLGHGTTLYGELLKVPLVFVHPDLARNPREIDVPVSVVDVLPTLLELTDTPAPGGMMGRSLVPLIDGRDAPDEPWARPVYGELADFKSVQSGHQCISRGFADIIRINNEKTCWNLPAIRVNDSLGATVVRQMHSHCVSSQAKKSKLAEA